MKKLALSTVVVATLLVAIAAQAEIDLCLPGVAVQTITTQNFIAAADYSTPPVKVAGADKVGIWVSIKRTVATDSINADLDLYGSYADNGTFSKLNTVPIKTWSGGANTVPTDTIKWWDVAAETVLPDSLKGCPFIKFTFNGKAAALDTTQIVSAKIVVTTFDRK